MPITTTPSGGPQGEFSTYTPIYATTLSSNTLSITFSNIPTTFTDLVLVVNGKSVAAGSSANGMRSSFNNDSSALYSETGLTGDGTSASSYRLSSTTYLNLGDLPQASGGPSANIINIMNYSNPNTFKTVLTRNNTPSSGVTEVVGLYRSTSPITSMTLTRDGSTNIASGTTFTLYGIKAATPAPKATGGDLVYTDNTYWYHVFKNSGVLDVKTAMSVDYLVVAGGAGGSYRVSGGGGAGGMRCTVTGTGGSGSLETALSVLPIQYPITVGGGGAGGVSTNAVAADGTNGSNSTFSTITSTGGGRPGSDGGFIGTPATGGSGGGGSIYTAGAAASPSGQGFAGGSGTIPYTTGGGGGASQAGNNGGAQAGGAGGNGRATSISGSSVTYAGGGGGGSGGVSSPTGGAGGTGGGGAGTVGTTTGGSGTANTGGGGGGGGGTNPWGAGGSGGSGIVIVRYAV